MELNPVAALLLADRLTRAAHVVLETGDEDLPDVQREYERHRPAA